MNKPPCIKCKHYRQTTEYTSEPTGIEAYEVLKCLVRSKEKVSPIIGRAIFTKVHPCWLIRWSPFCKFEEMSND